MNFCGTINQVGHEINFSFIISRERIAKHKVQDHKLSSWVYFIRNLHAFSKTGRLHQTKGIMKA